MDAELVHESTQQEHGLSRQVSLVAPVKALGDLASAMLGLSGREVSLTGFLAPASRKSVRLVVHVTHYHIIDEV
jgi:primosomal replication protein N